MLIICAALMLCIMAPEIISAQSGEYFNNPISVDGTVRAYRLYVPGGYNGVDALPTVFVFHGFGGSAMTTPNALKLYDIADTAMFFIIYPQGLICEDLVFGGSGTGWNIPGNYVAPQDDILFMHAILDEVIANPDVQIDEARIFACGHSSGAEMTYYCACALSEKFAAFTGVSGSIALIMMDSLCTPDRQLSLMHVHGTADPFFPVNGNEFFPSLEGNAEYWAEIDGCDLIPEVIELPDIDTTDGSTVTLKIYNNCDPGFEVRCYRVEGGGHSWPGTGPYPGTNMDIHASVEMWAFFKRNPHPYLVSVQETELVSDFNISPNPISGFANLRFTMYEQGFTILELFDVSGVKTKTLINGQKLPGTHLLEIDLSDLPVGVYFCVLRTNDGIQTRRLIKL